MKNKSSFFQMGGWQEGLSITWRRTVALATLNGFPLQHQRAWLREVCEGYFVQSEREQFEKIKHRWHKQGSQEEFAH